jgi:hypothetical protein
MDQGGKFLQLFEMPVGTVQKVGDWTAKHSFTHKDDMRLLTSPKLTDRIRNAFRNVPVVIDIFFVNSKAGRHYTELGLVDNEFPFRGRIDTNRYGAGQQELNIRQDGLGLSKDEVQTRPDAISIFFTNNKGDQRFPMTPWIMAHRIGHVLRNRSQRPTPYGRFSQDITAFMTGLTKCYGGLTPPRNANSYGFVSPFAYDTPIRQVAHAIGTMRSARTRDLRNAGEFVHELFAQYLITGRIELNPIPDRIPVKFAWGRPIHAWLRDRPTAERIREQMLTTLPQLALQALHAAVGHTFVM